MIETDMPSFQPRLVAALAAALASLGLVVAAALPGFRKAPEASDLLARRGLRLEPATALVAASRGDVFALSLLSGKGMDGRVADAMGRTPLMLASAAGHLECARFLEARTTEPQALDGNGRSALAHAVEGGRAEVARFLVTRARDEGINPDISPELLAAAARHADTATLEVLLEAGATRGLDEALGVAIKGKQVSAARLLLRRGAGPDVLVDGSPAIGHVLGADGREMLDLLCLFGARPDLPGPNGETALLRTVRAGDPGLAAYLLDHGADANRTNDQGQAPLLAAAEAEHEELVVLLLERGADPGLRTPDGFTLLGRALSAEKWAAARRLIAAGADPDAPCQGESSPMEIALRDQKMPLARLLLENGAVPHPSLLFSAVESGSFELIDLFLDHGAPVDARDARGETLLASACRAGDLALATRLIFRGANTRLAGPEGQEPLVIAIAARQPKLVEFLLKCGADPNRRLREPFTQEFLDLADSKPLAWYMTRDTRFAPLMVAAAVGDADTIRVLLKHGASLYPTTKSYQRYPISFAVESGNIEVQQLLVGYDPKTAEQEIRIVIDLAVQKATLFKDGELSLTSKVSTGTASHRTPTGDFIISHKHRTWTSTLYHCEMPYFMRLSCAAFGMHVGYVPNYPASHGCIRMPQSGAVDFWNNAPVGTPVSIIDSSKSATASNP